VNQCNIAAGDAFDRILSKGRNGSVGGIGELIAARLAWTLSGVKPRGELLQAQMVSEQGAALGGDSSGPLTKFPLVGPCLTLELKRNVPIASDFSGISKPRAVQNETSLANRVLFESFAQNEKEIIISKENVTSTVDNSYSQCLDTYLSAIVQISENANEKPLKADTRKVATTIVSTLPQRMSLMPWVTSSSLNIISSLCNLDGITGAIKELTKTSNTPAESAAMKVSMDAAEKRAKMALVTLREAAFQRSKLSTRRAAVECAVAISSGRLVATPNIQESALKLVMNVLYKKSTELADMVVASAISELERAAEFSIENYDKIQEANKAVEEKQTAEEKVASEGNPLLPISEEEKAVMGQVRRLALLFQALCVRRPELIKNLMSSSCKNRADVLFKAVRSGMAQFARAAAKTYGAPEIALQVSHMAEDCELPFLLALLDNLSPSMAHMLPSQTLVDACLRIYESKLDKNGKSDPRFIIPIVSAMKREDLVNLLPKFVKADDTVFMAALTRMSERLGRKNLIYRETTSDPIVGMTLCEQVVFLHKLDFNLVDIPQKNYLKAIKICLEDKIFSDRVIQASLDYMSTQFLNENGDPTREPLPLAFMRTTILACSRHKSLHHWIRATLLQRLVQGQIYTDKRQWEGWMRCANILARLDGDADGSSSIEAIRETIQNLPQVQLDNFRKRYPGIV